MRSICDVSTEAAGLAAELRGAMGRLSRRLRRGDSSDTVGATGLSLLGRLRRDGPSSASELARGEHLQPQSLTRVLRALEQRGLISRTVDGADRRRATIAVTAAGSALLGHTIRARERRLAALVQRTLTSMECDHLRLGVALIERLAAAAE